MPETQEVCLAATTKPWPSPKTTNRIPPLKNNESRKREDTSITAESMLFFLSLAPLEILNSNISPIGPTTSKQ